LLLFAALTTGGVLLYLAWPTVPVIIAGLLLVMAWPALGLPATFSLVGEELAGEKRIVGFTVQAVVKRLPILVAPPLGGILIERFGMRGGVRLGFAASVGLSLGMLALLGHAFGTRRVLPRGTPVHDPGAARPVLSPALRRLLAADILVRLCEGLPDVFIVVWVLEVVRLSPSQFGLLTSILVGTAILSYVPAVALAARAEKKWFIVLTYAFFTLFPLAVLASRSFGSLAAAFVIGGLREIGEPARKAFIVDSSRPEARGRAAGLYYSVRGFAVAGAAGIGGLLWTIRPSLTFLVAAVLGAAGTLSCALFLPSARESRR
jgi:Na+/melibiose symporter-like transporter